MTRAELNDYYDGYFKVDFGDKTSKESIIDFVLWLNSISPQNKAPNNDYEKCSNQILGMFVLRGDDITENDIFGVLKKHFA